MAIMGGSFGEAEVTNKALLLTWGIKTGHQPGYGRQFPYHFDKQDYPAFSRHPRRHTGAECCNCPYSKDNSENMVLHTDED